MAPTRNEGDLPMFMIEGKRAKPGDRVQMREPAGGAGDPAAFKGAVDVVLDKAVWVQWDNGDYSSVSEPKELSGTKERPKTARCA